jgi:long-chain acyl-CoA synthetase
MNDRQTDKQTKDCYDDVYYPENISEIIANRTDEKMVDHIRFFNMNHLNDAALMYLGIEITYGELFKNIDDYARALKRQGLKKGDYITICLPNAPETVYYVYACNDIGVTPYLIDPRYSYEKIVSCINISRSKVFVCEEGTYYKKLALHTHELGVDNVIIVSPLYSYDMSRELSVKQRVVKCLFDLKYYWYRAHMSSYDKICYQREFIKLGQEYIGNISEKYDSSIPAIVVNTSGTSGDSVKGAKHSNFSYNTIANQVEFITTTIKRKDTYYGYIPFFSMYGSAVGMHNGLSHGFAIHVVPKFEYRKSIREYLKNMDSVLIGVPALLDKILDEVVKRNVDMSSAKYLVIGGDNIPPDKIKKANEILRAHGMPHDIIFGYGSSEAGILISTTDDKRSNVYGSSGVPCACTKVRIIDPDTLEQRGYKEEGEIIVSTPSMMMGYLGRGDEDSKVFLNIEGERFFRTGDKGYLTENGHMYFTGRYKRLMKRPDGHQVSPIPIENAINHDEMVEDCVVVGIKKSKLLQGVIPTAFLVPTEGISLGAKEIASIAKESLKLLSGEREMALAYTVVDSIPYTDNGKVDYREVEKHNFSDGEYYILDDVVTRDYFGRGYEFVKI